jgi:hypothetical protein
MGLFREGPQVEVKARHSGMTMVPSYTTVGRESYIRRRHERAPVSARKSMANRATIKFMIHFILVEIARVKEPRSYFSRPNLAEQTVH